MNLEKLKEPLKITEIDFRVQSVNAGGYATILAYKDARTDMDRLDEVCGALNWKREHTRDNHNCIVSIYDKEKKEWVSKEDTGVESMSEQEKGLASDSFKRACFNWGIGRELYNYPIIQIQLFDNEYDKEKKKPTWQFKLKEWKWTSEFKDNKLVVLKAIDEKGRIRYEYGKEVVLPKEKPKELKTLVKDDEAYQYFEKEIKAKNKLVTLDYIKSKYQFDKLVETQLVRLFNENK